MKKFLVNIYAYDYHSRFEVKSNDDAISLEQAIVDKLGENSIVWESSGMFRDIPYRITYEKWSELMTKLEKSLQRSSWKKQLLPTGKILLKVPLHKFL